MWIIIEFLILLSILIFLFTQIVVPLFFPSEVRYFWFFRRDKSKNTLEQELEKLKNRKQEVNLDSVSVQDKINEQFNKVKHLKEDSEKI